MFTIPYDYEYEISDLRLQRDEALKFIHDNISWIQIIPHGLMHIPREFERADKNAMRLSIMAIDEAFKKDGLPYEKGFKAPYWLWNKDVCEVLDELGWWGAVDPHQPGMDRTKKTYTYSYSIHEKFWTKDDEVLKLHGHMTLPSSNNLEDCLLNLFRLPPDTKFEFVTKFLDK